MVDALVSVASEVAEHEAVAMEINVDDVRERKPLYEILPSFQTTVTAPSAPIRFCELCKSSQTPTWRRGPTGKGSLCNACGIKWRLKKRLKKSDSTSGPRGGTKKFGKLGGKKLMAKKLKSAPTFAIALVASANKPIKKRHSLSDLPPMSSASASKRMHDLLEHGRVPSTTVQVQTYALAESTLSRMKKTKYYCKYCDTTWKTADFKNSQQFGAHCSNCSRRPRSDRQAGGGHLGESDSSPISYSTQYDSSTSADDDNDKDSLMLGLKHLLRAAQLEEWALVTSSGELYVDDV